MYVCLSMSLSISFFLFCLFPTCSHIHMPEAERNTMHQRLSCPQSWTSRTISGLYTFSKVTCPVPWVRWPREVIPFRSLTWHAICTRGCFKWSQPALFSIPPKWEGYLPETSLFFRNSQLNSHEFQLLQKGALN